MTRAGAIADMSTTICTPITASNPVTYCAYQQIIPKYYAYLVTFAQVKAQRLILAAKQVAKMKM